MTCATAIASWIGEPSKPYERSWKRWKKSDSSATNRPARPASRSRSAWARVKSALCVTSRPIIVIGIPLAKTIAAASGSTKALNSAAGRDVPLADRSAHPDDALDPLGHVWVALEQKRDVRERSRRDEHDARLDELREEVGGVRVDGLRGRLGKLRPVETGLAVHVRRSAKRRGAAARPPLLRPGCRSGPPISSVTSALRVVLSSVWLPATVVTPTSSSSGDGEREQDRHRVVVAGVTVDDDLRAHRSASTSSAVGSEVWAPKRDAARAPAAQARRSDSSRDRPSSSETTRQAVNASPAAVPSTASTAGGSARATSSPSSSSTAPSAPSVSHDEAWTVSERLELEPVHDGQLGGRRAVARGRGVEEEARRELGRPRDRLGRDLLLAEDRVGVVEREILGPQLGVRARRDDDGRLPRRVDRDQRDPGRGVLGDPALLDAGLTQPRERLFGELVAPDAPDQRDLGPEPRRGDRLVRALAAGHAREARAAHRLARARQPLRLHDEVEVDRADDGEAARPCGEPNPMCIRPCPADKNGS